MTSSHPLGPPLPEEPVLDPHLDAQALAKLASERRDLWPAIQQHPNCYSELRDWISQQLAQPERKPSEEEWARSFQEHHGREPSMSEYQAALKNREIRKHSPAMEEFSEGARRAVVGAKGLFDEHVAPAAKNAARQAQAVYNKQTAPSSLGLWAARSPLILSISAFLAIFTLFLPIVKVGSVSINFFHDDMDGEGTLLIVSFVVTIGMALSSYFVHRRGLRIAAGIVGIVAGLIAALDGFSNIYVFSNESMASVGSGIILLALFGVMMLVASVLTLLSARDLKKPAPAPLPPTN